MKNLQLINDDYLGYVNRLRHACRGIVVKDGKVLLSYESKNDKYMIPGGGVEEDENYAQCCERELLEETGFKVRATEEYLEIEELFLDWRHINHYFVCEYVEDTGKQNLTEGEKEAGYKAVWMPLDEALEVFGKYESFHKTKIEDYGLYRREYFALKEYGFEYRFFDGTQTVIGHGAQADVYSYHGYAYKVYRPTYNPEWIKFEKAQQSVVNATGLCNVRYYDTEDLYTVKMDLVEGETLEKKIRNGFEGGFDILAAMFRKVHNAELDDVKMPGLIDTAGFGISDENRQKILPVIVRLSEKMDSCICHLDLHFLNIMMPFDGSEPVIIDWINARIAPAVFDYARTYVILRECAPDVLGMYEAAVAADMRSLGITDEDFADAVMVSQVIRDREKKD